MINQSTLGHLQITGLQWREQDDGVCTIFLQVIRRSNGAVSAEQRFTGFSSDE